MDVDSVSRYLASHSFHVTISGVNDLGVPVRCPLSADMVLKIDVLETLHDDGSYSLEDPYLDDEMSYPDIGVDVPPYSEAPRKGAP
jgi:hypothetical protein